RPDELARCSANADPIEQEAHLDAARGGPGERSGESVADVVGSKDVALEDDAGRGVVDQVEHRVEGGGPVAEQAHTIAARDVGGGDAPEPAGEGRPGSGQVEAAAVEHESAGWGRHRGGGLQDVCRQEDK